MVSGVQRIAYRIQGNACPGTVVPTGILNHYDNNEAHSTMIGVTMWPVDKGFDYDTSKIFKKEINVRLNSNIEFIFYYFRLCIN